MFTLYRNVALYVPTRVVEGDLQKSYQDVSWQIVLHIKSAQAFILVENLWAEAHVGKGLLVHRLAVCCCPVHGV